ncbi:DNA invertase Pin-like site-specific DNA recombinase [Actinokineospora baliensis]|uniref:recombinase family protein n=1 Tax=Actinokineospora baliensis TaxID=547056 RepID=UPI001957A135|nr:recombinase family protein [Actinokineospora baliensis]MBM7771250.1 DNA invertase Pin-like site-specific DNA recombinase [Actinokineospora baliensis]
MTRLRGVIYARASADKKGRAISVASQVAAGKLFFKENGIELVAILRDNDMSASRYAVYERPDYKRALDLLRSGDAKLLWTWENSRAQRELDVFVVLRKLLIEVGGFWAYDDRIYDMNDPDDRIDTAEDAVDSERESEKTRKRVLRGVKNRANDGWWHGPKPFGYTKVFHPESGEAIEMVPHPVTGPAVKEMAKRAIAKKPYSSIAKYLNDANVPTPRDGRWNARQVKNIYAASLDAVAWANLMDQCSPEQQELARDVVVRVSVDREHPSWIARSMNMDGKPTVYASPWNGSKVRSVLMNPAIAGLRVLRGTILCKGRWEALITEKQRTLLMVRLGNPTVKPRRDGIRAKHLLSGILGCSKCERFCYAHKRDGGIYACNQGHISRRVEDTDAFITEMVLARLESAPELFRVTESTDELSRAQADAEELRARLEGFTTEAVNGNLTAKRLAVIEAQLLPKIEAAEKRIHDLSTAPTLAPIAGAQARQVWADLDLAGRREVLRTVMRPRLVRTPVRGRFDPDAVSVTWLSGPVIPDPNPELVAA